MPSSISVKRPDKLRIESTSKAGTVTIVGDGEHTWFYVSTVKKYAKRAAVESPEAVVINSGLLPKNLPDLNQSIKSIKLAGEEAIDVGGVKTVCWVIETIFEKITLPEQNVTVRDAVAGHLDKQGPPPDFAKHLHRYDQSAGRAEPVEMTQSTHTTRVRLDAALPGFIVRVHAACWRSRKPRIGRCPGITKPDLIGKPAPVLTAKANAATAATEV